MKIVYENAPPDTWARSLPHIKSARFSYHYYQKQRKSENITLNVIEKNLRRSGKQKRS